ncbi:hypothetical protein SAMN06265182_0568 [Persephonella hydrogeniphila]|uniref:Uncharacterized protein n=2 Tax=Persephonella hydrogeniphila TaxID=198703 RepID=A0A285N9Z3_9AQUI|nr:hypothetical protein SAMN06265182_0568 [Persephonella hydrogeniphila]
MGSEDFLEKGFKDVLKKVSLEKNLRIPDEIISYISGVMSLYYRGIPLYLIDISETSPFKKYKARGDVSLLLVGLFTEWIERANRPISEKDYIKAGKLNYYNAYMYLNLNFGEVEREFYDILSSSFDITNMLLTHMDIFRDISENFERYALLLKEYRAENLQTVRLFDIFNELRQSQLKKFLDDL